MKKLPSEILGEIFLYLHPKDKIDCMLVCQHWKQVIEVFALFHALDIRSETSLKKLTEIVEENPDIGKKVEHLTISFREVKGDFDLSGLLLLLPNIRTLFCTGPELISLMALDNIIYPWRKHIEYINEYSFKSITSSLLLSNICSNLTTIDVIDLHSNNTTLLKNAPALKNLTLSDGSITFDDLDAIHENSPCLESFTARGLTLENSELSQNVNPAVLVTQCHFDEIVVTSRSLETRKVLLVYVSKKYPNLSKFTYTFIRVNQSYDVIEKITDSDWLPLLQNLAPKLKKLSICSIGWADNTFDVLDRCNCQIDYLKICGLSSTGLMKIVQSQQIYCIQTLILYDINFETFGWLNELQTLKRLKLYYSPFESRPDIALDIILDNSPLTLRSLSLCRVRLTADPKYIGLSNIECLSFYDAEISEGIDTFISLHFPKLTNLKLRQCDVIEKTFNLEKMKLLNLTYEALFSNDNFENLLIVTSNNNERRWYPLEDDDGLCYGVENMYNNLYRSVKSRLQNETDTEPHFTLLCNSLNRCIFKS